MSVRFTQPGKPFSKGKTVLAGAVFLALLGFSAGGASAQSGALSGRVTANGQPVPNAGVMAVRGTTVVETAANAQGQFTFNNLTAGTYTVSAVAYGHERASSAQLTVSATGAVTVPDLALTSSPLFPATVYDEFTGTELDMSKWTLANEIGDAETIPTVENGELTLTGPAGDNRAGIMSTTRQGAAASIVETVVTGVDEFATPGAHNAILQLYTGDGGFNRFVEFGLEGANEAGIPTLHVWGAGNDVAGPAPSNFPITLSVVRHNNTLDFYANQQWFHSAVTTSLTGDHSVFLYGFGASVPHFGSVSMKSVAVTTGTLQGRVTANGQPVANAGVRISGTDTTRDVYTDANGSYAVPNLTPGAYTVTSVAYGYERATPASQNVAAGGTANVPDLALTPSPLYPATVYDEFTGTELDTSKWTYASEVGAGEAVTTLENGELTLAGPGGDTRAGIMSTAKQLSTASIVEATVTGVDELGQPGAHNAILQLYTGDGGFNNFVEFGIEGVEGDPATGRPILHVWGGGSDIQKTAPSGFPIKLTVVRHDNTLDFFANGTWIHSLTTTSLKGDHSVFLYGYGGSVSHFGSVALKSTTATTGTLSGRVTAGGQGVANAGVLITGADFSKTLVTDSQGSYTTVLNPGAYTVSVTAYGFEPMTSAAQTINVGGTATGDVALTASPLFPPAVYDEFTGTALDPSKWTLFNETQNPENPVQAEAIVENGELTLVGPDGARAGIMSTAKQSAAGSVAEATVTGVDDFGQPGAHNAILQLYTGDGGFNHFVEFGIEGSEGGDPATGKPILHVWGAGQDYAGPAPSNFPIKLTVVRRNNALDFFANGQFVYSTTTTTLTGDHSVVLYGFGTSVPHFASAALSSGGAPSVKKGDVNANGTVEVGDAVLTLRFAVNAQTPTDAQRAAANVNGDTGVNVTDAVLILQRIVGLISTFPGG